MAQITKLYLMHCDLESDYQHTLAFTEGGQDEQRDYFLNKAEITLKFDDFNYQRLDHTANVSVNIDTLLKKGINYCAYQNTEYNNKWFYCFITNLEYCNPDVTKLHLETDVIQTWYYDSGVTFNKSFIEREHAGHDAPGDFLIDEGLELGEYIVNNHATSGFGNSGLSVVIGVTETPEGSRIIGGMVQNSYSSIQYYTFDASEGHDQTAKLGELISSYDSDAAANAIVCVFMAPNRLVGTQSANNYITGERFRPTTYYLNGTTGAANDLDVEITTGRIDGYEPRNKKLLTYPFRYMLCSNNAGGAAIYKYELFYATNKKQTFIIEGVITPGCSIRLTPLFYNGEPRNDEEGLNMGKFPVCNWNSDIFTNWLTQNGVNIGVSLATGAAQVVGGVVATVGSSGLGAGAGLMTAASGLSQITNTLTKVHEQSFTPAQSRGNTNSGDVVTAAWQNDFHFYDMTIKREYAQIIDEYFDMFGYKVNRVKDPAWNHRNAYWYIKTINANITGKAPQDVIKKIKDIFNNGITFWRSTATFRDYGQDNSIM